MGNGGRSTRTYQGSNERQLQRCSIHNYKHRDYFTSLSDIEIIRVFGHSYNDIDMPYFQKIKDSVSKECKWILNWHSDNDKVNAENLIAQLGIPSENVEYINQ